MTHSPDANTNQSITSAPSPLCSNSLAVPSAQAPCPECDRQSASSASIPHSLERRHDPYAAIRISNYRLFASGWVFASLGLQMQGLALSWEIYERTHDPFQLGLVGLCRALPVVALALPAGHIIDSFSRRKVLILTQIGFAIVSALIAVASFKNASLFWMYALIVLSGCARVFNGPSRASLLPMLVPPRAFHNAVTWNSGVFQTAALLGPILAGFMIDKLKIAWPVYAATSLGCMIFVFTASFIKLEEPRRRHKDGWIAGMTAGMNHLWREKNILGAITLDLFAVLLGGATALLPVYAKDILHVGPVGLGWLKSAAYIGALTCVLIQAHRPPIRRCGSVLLISVACFGVAMILFGFSNSFWLSMACLIFAGAVDNISIVIRHVLVQAKTPDHLRGRVAAVNSVFIESSNELGAFESGTVAKLFSPIISVVSGGIGTLLVVLAVAATFPSLRKLGELHTDESDSR